MTKLKKTLKRMKEPLLIATLLVLLYNLPLWAWAFPVLTAMAQSIDIDEEK